MRLPSDAKVTELARELGVDVDEDERADIVEGVRSFLTGLDEVDDVPVPPRAADLGGRSWHVPEENPDNVVVHACDVPPTSDHGVLEDVTVGVKDVIAVAGVPMTGGSRFLQGHVPRADATCVARLLAAGATVTAKLNCDELATSGTGATSYLGPIRNPHDRERTAGGSSGGSAAAVATRTVDVALGTDTAGSVLGPASYCGVVGLKPTYGVVPLTGVVEHAYTIDHVGVFGRSVRQVGRALEAMAGKSDRDPASMAAAGRDEYRVGGYVEAVDAAPDLSEVRLGRLTDGFDGDLTPDVRECVDAAVDRLADAGATVTTRSIPHYEAASALNEAISYSELYSHWTDDGAPLRRGGLVDPDYQLEVARRIHSAGGELGAYYKQKLLAGAVLFESHAGRHYTTAQAAREALRDEAAAALEGVDALLCPARPCIAPRFDDSNDLDTARNARPTNVTGVPAVSVPCGTVSGMPVGLQLVGGRFEDASLLALASSIGAAFDAAE